MNKWWLFRLGYLADIFSNKQWICCLSGQYLLPMIKFELSSKSENFGKHVYAILCWITSQFVKIFQMRPVILMIAIFWCNVMKCVNIWKLWILDDWVSVLQLSNACDIKKCIKVQGTALDFNVTDNWYGFRSHKPLRNYHLSSFGVVSKGYL